MSKVQPQRAQYTALISEIGDLNENIRLKFDHADENGGEMTTADREQVKDWNKTIEAKSEKAAEIADMLGILDAANQRHRDAGTPANPMQFGNGSGESKSHKRERVMTPGERFVNDAAFKDYIEGISRGGHVASRTVIQSPPVTFEGFKALITSGSATSAGALIDPDITSIIDMGTSFRPLTVRDIITTGTTDSDAVQFVRQGTNVNAAAPVAEATATSGAVGVKPESEMVLEVVTETVKTIAHWIPATSRALQDAGQLRTLIDSFLRYGLEEELEDQILTGSGSGENFTGILNTTGTGTQAYDTSLLTTTRRARTKVMTEGRARPTAWVMNPLDWEDFDLLVDNETRYYFGGPMALGTPRLWGLPVVESEGMTEGVAVVADWRLAVLWDRMRVSISVSNQHSDFFIRNLIAILAEMRAAFGVLRPAAFIEVDLTA
jgi:HK97 family phage major capsid protein